MQEKLSATSLTDRQLHTHTSHNRDGKTPIQLQDHIPAITTEAKKCA